MAIHNVKQYNSRELMDYCSSLVDDKHKSTESQYNTIFNQIQRLRFGHSSDICILYEALPGFNVVSDRPSNIKPPCFVYTIVSP